MDRSLVFALRHEIRFEILRYLDNQGADKSTCPRELSEDLHHKLNVISYHVGVLRECGAIRLVDTEPARGALTHFYAFSIEEQWAIALLRLDGAAATEDEADSEGGAPVDD